MGKDAPWAGVISSPLVVLADTVLPMLELYDAVSGSVRPLELRTPGHVSVYVCGPTVYGPPHLGHGRAVLTWDVLRRYLLWRGLAVNFVSNVTDIDDKIIQRAVDEDRDWADIATKCEGIWWRAMDRLGVLRPDHVPHATDYVDQMVELIGRLVADERAYVTSDGVYLRTSDVPDYGLLSHQSLDDLLEGGGDREVYGTEKEHPADFALWKFTKPQEPSWPSLWGDGRPGWHTECVVMSLDLLGEDFDLHTGGMDLVFPHHENERAQAVADGKKFARHWAHNGFVEIDGTKMGKSLGNAMNLLDVLDTYDARAYRLLLLQAHYRSPIEVTAETLAAAEAALGRLDAFYRRAFEVGGTSSPDEEVVAAFREAVDRDLDTPAGIDMVFRQVRAGNAALDRGETDAARVAAATVAHLLDAFGLPLHAAVDRAPAEVMDKAIARSEARSAGDYGRADNLRDEILAAGWVVEDSADGPLLRPAD